MEFSLIRKSTYNGPKNESFEFELNEPNDQLIRPNIFLVELTPVRAKVRIKIICKQIRKIIQFCKHTKRKIIRFKS